MKNLIAKEHRHLLWQDELGGDFVLLKYAEVYKLSQNALRLHTWATRKLLLARFKDVELNFAELDEGFNILDVKIESWPARFIKGMPKRRPDINGKWIKDMEKRLAHKILPYEPSKLHPKIVNNGSN